MDSTLLLSYCIAYFRDVISWPSLPTQSEARRLESTWSRSLNNTESWWQSSQRKNWKNARVTKKSSKSFLFSICLWYMNIEQKHEIKVYLNVDFQFYDWASLNSHIFSFCVGWRLREIYISRWISENLVFGLELELVLFQAQW